MPRPTDRSYASLARNLDALSSETRLALLHVLRTPLALHDIRVPPSQNRAGARPERALSRQAVAHQLDLLLASELILRTEGDDARGDLYVLNHERLFAIVDAVRGLAKLRPSIAMIPGDTAAMDEPGPLVLPPGPRLLVAYGRDDGEAFSLAGPGPWSLGRAPGCHIRLDYDPYLSSEHATVHRAPVELQVRDAGSRNGTWVNGVRLEARRSHLLEPGDLLTVGRSNLVFQSPRA